MKNNAVPIAKINVQHLQQIASKEQLNSIKQNLVITFWWLYWSPFVSNRRSLPWKIEGND